jgi:hypothetical protein
MVDEFEWIGCFIRRLIGFVEEVLNKSTSASMAAAAQSLVVAGVQSCKQHAILPPLKSIIPLKTG